MKRKLVLAVLLAIAGSQVPAMAQAVSGSPKAVSCCGNHCCK